MNSQCNNQNIGNPGQPSRPRLLPAAAALTLAVLLFGTLSDASAQTRPSWCSSQPKLNAAEGAICASQALGDLDARLGLAFRNVLKSAGPRRAELLQGQREWLQLRNACGADAQCLAAAHQSRIATLAGPAGAATVQSAPQPGVTGGPASDEEQPRIQQTKDGRSLLSFPVLPGDDNGFDEYAGTFDFGQTKGLGGDKPLVNADKSLIVVTNYPATKTSYVHVFARQPAGDLLIINSFNARIARMLTGRWAEAASYRTQARSVSGRIMELSVFDYVSGNNAEEMKLRVSVGTDGTLTMEK